MSPLMMAGGIQVGSSGVAVGSSGVIVTDSDATPCCCGGAPCGTCSGSTPATWTLTFDSVALSTTCFTDGLTASGKITTGTTFSGTFTLTQSGSDPCFWEYDAAYSTIIAQMWGNLTCAGAVSQTTDRINIGLFKSPGNIEIGALLYVNGIDTGTVSAHLFEAGIATNDCCADITGQANGITAYAGHGELEFDLGKDGTVDATPNC